MPISGDELSIHDHELVLHKDQLPDVDYNEDFHMLSNDGYHDEQNMSPISRSLSESDLSELCLTTTGDAAIGAVNSRSPNALHGSLPPSDDENLHNLLQYDDDEIHQMQQHHNFNNNHRALLTSEVALPVSVEEGTRNNNGQSPVGDRYDDHNFSSLSTRNKLPPPPILPPKKGTVGSREQNMQHASPSRMYHHSIHDNTELPYHNDRNNEHLNRHAKSSRLNKMTSQQHQILNNEIKNNLNSTTAAVAAKKQQRFHEQKQHHTSNYPHQNLDQFHNNLGINNSGGSSSSSDRRNHNLNKAYQNSHSNEGNF